MKIHIFYRHYNISGNDFKNRPEWFNYEGCYQNLLSTLDLNTCKINIVYDGKGDNWIKKKHYHNFIEIEAKEDMKSFWETIKLANADNSIEDDDLIYFLENDYMHVDGWVNKVIELFSTYKGLDYVSLYDHNDKYLLPMYDNLVSKIFTSPTHHWRTTPSTCGSFITTKQRLNEDFDILSTMRGDHNKWLWLNENRSRFIFTPIPGLSTHCMNGLLSPTIKWGEI
tara:strand:+ start:310 stop:984 length:675 start_codon:yes stop_codon:yes gene_type:complete